jgi:hypothetical protein
MRWIVLASLLGAGAAQADELAPVAAAALAVTRGRVEARADNIFHLDEAKVRAVVRASDGNRAELRFSYAGPTVETATLGSGELRRQIGLKLRAEDGCNLVYVMWRIAPVPGIVVSVKRNPGQKRHAECGNGGYRNLRAERAAPAPLVTPGSAHVLFARIDGTSLTVWADGARVWQGPLPPEALALRGPVGLRSDNGRFAVQLRAGQGEAGLGTLCSDE